MSKINYEKDDVIVTSHGEYSDYMFTSIYMVLENFEIKSMMELWRTMGDDDIVLNSDGTINSYNSKFKAGSFEESFFGWLEEAQIIKLLDHKELHLGDYGDIKLEDYS